MADLRIPNFEQSMRVLRQTPLLLRNLLSTAPPDAFNWRPSSERWSIAMVLAHLADVEIRGFRDRFEPMLRSKHPALAAYEPWDLFREHTEFDAAAELARCPLLPVCATETLDDRVRETPSVAISPLPSPATADHIRATPRAEAIIFDDRKIASSHHAQGRALGKGQYRKPQMNTDKHRSA